MGGDSCSGYVGCVHGQYILYIYTSVLSMLLLSPCTDTVNCLQYGGKGGFAHHGLMHMQFWICLTVCSFLWHNEEGGLWQLEMNNFLPARDLNIT